MGLALGARPSYDTATRRRLNAPDGALAQLGERLHGMQEVSGSIPLGSTKLVPKIRIPKFRLLLDVSPPKRGIVCELRGEGSIPAHTADREIHYLDTAGLVTALISRNS